MNIDHSRTRTVHRKAKQPALLCRLNRWLGMTLLSGIIACSSTPSSDGTVGTNRAAVRTGETALASQTYSIVVSNTGRDTLLSTALIASTSINLGSGSRILGYGTPYAPVTNTGSGTLYVDADAKVGSLVSGGPVELRDRAHVAGNLTAASITKGNGTTVDGATNVPATPAFADVAHWNVTFPAGTFASHWLNTNESLSLDPGRYADVGVASSGRLKLSAGVYLFESLSLESGSIVDAVPSTETGSGPIVIYVRNRMASRGSVQTGSGTANRDVLVVYLSADELHLEESSNFAVVAPSARVSVHSRPQPHRVQVIAKQINVEGGAVIQHLPARALLAGSGISAADCSQLVPAPDMTDGREREVKFQYDILADCIATERAPDVNVVGARGNVDIFNAAREAARCAITPAQYLGVTRDRKARMRHAELDLAYASKLAKGADADGDWVIDSEDKCPNTATLLPVDETGCPVALPPGPDPQQVCDYLKGQQIAFNPFCIGENPPGIVPAVGIWASNTNNVYFYASEVKRGNPQCPIWYEWEFWMTDLKTNTVVDRLRAVFKDDEVGHAGTLAPLPKPFVEFPFLGTDSGARGQLVALRKQGYRAVYRVRALNDMGAAGPWTERRLSDKWDCRSVNVTCGE